MGQSACSCGPDRCRIIVADIVYQSGTDLAFCRGGGMVFNGIPRTPRPMHQSLIAFGGVLGI